MPRGRVLLGAVVVASVMAAGATAAHAGTYAAMTCADTAGNPIGAAGWSETSNASYVYPQTSCSSAGSSLSVQVGPNPGGYTDGQGGTLTYAVPAPLLIASYSLDLSDFAISCAIQNGACASGYGHVWLNHQGQVDPSYDFQTLGGTAPGGEYGASGLTGVQSVTLGAGCTAPYGTPCPGGVVIATAAVNSGVFQISDPSVPTVSDVGGTLIAGGTLSGTQDITFTASDAGSGVYSGIIRVDGTTISQQILNTNGGLCHDTGQIPGERSFDSAQPCPPQASGTLSLATDQLSDGQHDLQVLVDNAAGNAATVYDGTIITANRTTVSSLLNTAPPAPVAPVATAPTPAVYAFALSAGTRALHSSLTRRYAASSLTLSGTLENEAGVPAAGVTVALWARPVSGGPFVQLRRTTTTGTGGWSLQAPRGASRVLRIVAGAGGQPTSSPSVVSVTETVLPTLSLRVGTPGGARLVFSGRLAIAPLGVPLPLVIVEVRGPEGWQAVGAPVRVDRQGTYRYVYRSSPLTIGRRFAFRALTPAAALWAATVSPTHTAEVH